MHKVAAATGLEGFIGSHFLHKLLEECDHVISYLRRDRCALYSKGGLTNFYDNDDEFIQRYSPTVFYNLATCYKPHPSFLSDVIDISNSNISFPLRILSRLNTSDLHIVNFCSYLQLSETNNANLYNASKDYLKHSLDLVSKQTSHVFLFDTFGEHDLRDKVVDVFIKNILNGNSILIPSNEIFINLTHVSDVINSLEEIPLGESCIHSPFTLSLTDLAKILMKILDKEVDIIFTADSVCLYSECERLPVNIFNSANGEIISNQLTRRCNEIRNTKTA